MRINSLQKRHSLSNYWGQRGEPNMCTKIRTDLTTPDCKAEGRSRTDLGRPIAERTVNFRGIEGRNGHTPVIEIPKKGRQEMVVTDA